MELITLDENFQPQSVVENYDSLIWSERYFKAGDFQLVTNDVGYMINTLAREQCVTLRNSTVPMLVETFKIQKPARAAPILTVTGRSYEAAALERRLSVNTMPTASARQAWTMLSDKPSDAAYRAIREVIGDQARSRSGTQVLPAQTPAISPLDALPTIDLTLPVDFSAATPNSFEIKAGNLYNAVLELIATNNRGIKSVRPGVGGNKIAVEIYNGADLTNEVVFDAKFDQFDDATYLLSDQGATNVGYVYGSNGSQKVLKNTGPEPSGMDRRLLLLDESSDNTANTETIRRNRGLVELYKYNATALFDGQVGAQVAEGFNDIYFLGDILQLVGEYGLSQNVRVTEFIRSIDNQGEKSYPAFEAVLD